MFGDILQPTHLLFVLVIALLVLGPKRLPEVGRTLGAGLRDFRSAISGETPEHSERGEPEYIYAPPEEVEPEGTVDTAQDDALATAVAVEAPPAPDDVPPPLSVAPAESRSARPETTV